MADHNFLTDTYDANTAILDGCKSHITEVVLPTEPASQFEDGGVVVRTVIDAINATLGDVSETFEGQAYMYRFAKKGVCLADTNYAAKLTDSIDDIVRLTSTLNSMGNLMNVECSTNSFIGSLGFDINTLLANGLVSIELSDYISQDGNGKFVYNMDSIKNFFGDVKYKDAVSQKDILIIESLLYSCADGDVIDFENLEMILNASLLAKNESHKERFPDMWNWVSREMSTYTEVLITQNYDLLTPSGVALSEEELELKRKIKTLIMLNDTVKVMNSRAKSIQSARFEGERILVEEATKSDADHIYDYLSKNGITGFLNEKKLNEYNENWQNRILDAAIASKISLTYHQQGDTDNLLPYLEFGIGKSSTAYIQEFTSTL